MENKFDKTQEYIKARYDKESQACFAFDIHTKEVGQRVSLTGRVKGKDIYKKHGFALVYLTDITGTITVRMNFDIFDKNRDAFLVANTIKLNGVVADKVKKDSLSHKIIENPEDIVVSFSLSRNFGDKHQIGKKESLMLLSRIIDSATTELKSKNFFQFESKLISTHSWDSELESLRVVYPGFGAPAALITSPAPQVLDFLLTSCLEKAFTVSTSFSASYRFKGLGTEPKVIVAKAFNISIEEYKNLMYQIMNKIFVCLNKDYKQVIPHEIGNINWENDFENINFLQNEINYIQYVANIPVHQKNWHTKIEGISHIIYGNSEALLVEGAREKLNDNVNISTIVIYPSQFLVAIGKNPMNRLSHLGRSSHEKQ
jgi:hypothetical protein